METDLVHRILEFSKRPESRPADLSIQKTLDIVEDGIVCHRTLHYIVGVCRPSTAGHHEIQPLIRQFRESFDVQRCIIERIDINDNLPCRMLLEFDYITLDILECSRYHCISE